MNIQITVSPDVYRGASETEIKLQELIGLTKDFHVDADDLNGDKAKSKYLEGKFIKE